MELSGARTITRLSWLPEQRILIGNCRLVQAASRAIVSLARPRSTQELARTGAVEALQPAGALRTATDLGSAQGPVVPMACRSSLEQTAAHAA